MTNTIAHNRITAVFENLRNKGKRALMPFLVGGHPSIELLPEMLRTIDAAGASVIEIGFPFSDPIADGPVIAAAMYNALQAGASADSVLESVASCRADIDAGLVAMISVSLVYRMGGPAAFAKRAKDAGIDGFIFPDVTLEQADPYVDACAEHGLCASLLVAPTTPIERAKAIAEKCSGFVYVIARAGITGASDEAPEIDERITQLRSVTDLPLAVGFGISTPDHVRSVTRSADAAIVGSALVREIDRAGRDGVDAIEAARRFVFTLAEGLG